MFCESEINGDISTWHVANVTNMNYMFRESEFNGDISSWNVANVRNMSWMFYRSKFNGDISSWNVSNVTDMKWMFYGSQFNGDISTWNVAIVREMSCMFKGSKFNGDISGWAINNISNLGLPERSLFDHNFNHNTLPNYSRAELTPPLYNESCPVCKDDSLHTLLVAKCRHAVCLDCYSSLRLPKQCPLCRSLLQIVAKIS